MLNIVSILIGIIGLLLAIVGLFPLLGWTNWFWLIVPVIGAGVGQLSSSDQGRNFNLFVIAVMALRLFIGGGVF